MDRPATSKSRGICKYYKEPRGCFAGSKCKFLHGEPNSRGLTPYDQAKTCRFYAEGYCKRGDKCWFKHIPRAPSPSVEDEDEPCSICFEQPVTYGLLMGCSHVFCISCIKQWRDSSKQNRDPGPSKVTKQCPMCRAPSAYITPSSVFYKNEDPGKEKAIISYKESMARVPCRYFQTAKREDPTNPFCPFGKDCFYQHLNDDGTPHVFTQGVEACMRIYARRRGRPANGFPFPGHYPDPVEMIGLFMDTMDNHFSDIGTFEGTYDLVRTEIQRLGLDSDDLPIGLPPAAAVSRYIGDLLRPGGPQRLSVSNETMPNLEPIISQSSRGNHPREGVRRNRHGSDDDSMPPLENVDETESNSDSDWSTSEDDDEDETRPLQAPRFLFGLHHPSVVATWTAGGDMDLGIDVDDETPDSTEDALVPTPDGGQSSTENGPPPFVTDGRGRVIGASEEEQDNSRSRSIFGRFFFSRTS